MFDAPLRSTFNDANAEAYCAALTSSLPLAMYAASAPVKASAAPLVSTTADF